MSQVSTPSPVVSQRQVTSLVRSGVFWSVLWLFGIGSIIALTRGVEARRLIRDSGSALKGGRGAWWCIIVGTIGLVIWLPFLSTAVITLVRRALRL